MAETVQNELVESIKSAISMSGMLFQRHPEHPEWNTTRPGAEPGEVAAFVHDVDGQRKSFISVCRWYKGEKDLDGYEWTADCWEILIRCADGSFGREIETDIQDAAGVVARGMNRIGTQ